MNMSNVTEPPKYVGGGGKMELSRVNDIKKIIVYMKRWNMQPLQNVGKILYSVSDNLTIKTLCYFNGFYTIYDICQLLKVCNSSSLIHLHT